MTPLFLSQSEAADWAGCPLRAHARWFMGLRPPDDEDPDLHRYVVLVDITTLTIPT